MQEVFAAERLERQEEYVSMEKEMTGKMEEGSKIERLAKEQAQNEIKKEMDMLKEEMKIQKIRSGSAV